MRERAAGERTVEDLGDLFQPRLVGRGVDAHARELFRAVRGADPKHETAATEEIEGDRVFGEP